ncbi:putative GDP-mannose 4,6-dehydratase [SAR86 cluster bacterium SAR86E]|uniref:GDP-mannose 4,6-dehydratase n=1 Tax=SAR86 cluster bacterium SAR86E TaxID=1208365 RepID=K6H0I7_9GAMM|nr:putative GDP-mannose 4,6-dehydratase [SAR86 cluster bacterium SAR86E]
MAKTALINGISGQDGSLMAHHLLSNDYNVIGISRDATLNSFSNLIALNIKKDVELISSFMLDPKDVQKIIRQYKPNEIYNLGGQSSVSKSYQNPIDTMISHCQPNLNILECLRHHFSNVRYYNACSGECFGDTAIDGADENTPFNPKSPYGVAKAAAYFHTSNYRDAYDLFVSSGILFNHESHLRGDHFVTKKICLEAKKIAEGTSKKLVLGDLSIQRDWGWAPQYIEAMWLMLQNDTPGDYVIASGISYSLEEFVKLVFDYYGLEWSKYVHQSDQFIRPSEIQSNFGLPEKAKNVLNWSPKYQLKDIVRMMIENKLY